MTNTIEFERLSEAALMLFFIFLRLWTRRECGSIKRCVCTAAELFRRLGYLGLLERPPYRLHSAHTYLILSVIGVAGREGGH